MSRKKSALITGITGQDGAYLARFLLNKGYTVHGIVRRSSSGNLERISPIIDKLHLHPGDLTDTHSIHQVIEKCGPDEVYNLGAQSHVKDSFSMPEYTVDAGGLGTLRLIEALRQCGLDKTRFYQASTSELYGEVAASPQKESTPFHPRSPYGVAKLMSYWAVVNYREAYGMFACNGILFNHESPLRGIDFVTRKITRGLVSVALGLADRLSLGNLDAKRDWGHARDYVEAQWLMLQQEKPQDYVIATGEQHTVRDFVEKAARTLGIRLNWQGSGLDECAIIAAVDPLHADFKLEVGQTIVSVDPAFFRPAEVATLLGDASKAHAELGWKPKTSFDDLVKEMVLSDLDALAKRRPLCV